MQTVYWSATEPNSRAVLILQGGSDYF